MATERPDSLTEKSLGPLETYAKQRLALQRVEELKKQSGFRNLRVFCSEVDGGGEGEKIVQFQFSIYS